MILDTNALSAFADGEPAAVAEVGRARLVAVPVIVLGEYRYGMAQSRQRLDYERWLERFLPGCQVLEVTSETAFRYAEIRCELKSQGTPIPGNDAWIAALCRQHAFPVLSHDQHFDLVSGIRRLSW